MIAKDQGPRREGGLYRSNICTEDRTIVTYLSLWDHIRDLSIISILQFITRDLRSMSEQKQRARERLTVLSQLPAMSIVEDVCKVPLIESEETLSLGAEGIGESGA
jgi:hypothetical protein